MNSIQIWIDDVITNESGIIWTEWSKCDTDCKQTRLRSKYESEVRECKGVCFKPTADIIDGSLRTCSIAQNRDKRELNYQKRIMGGQTGDQGSMPYVAKLGCKTFSQKSDIYLEFLRVLHPSKSCCLITAMK